MITSTSNSSSLCQPLQMSHLPWLYRLTHQSRTLLSSTDSSLIQKICIFAALTLASCAVALSIVGIIPLLRAYDYWNADNEIEALLKVPSIASFGEPFKLAESIRDDGSIFQRVKSQFCAIQRLKIEQKIYAWGFCDTRCGNGSPCIVVHEADWKKPLYSSPDMIKSDKLLLMNMGYSDGYGIFFNPKGEMLFWKKGPVSISKNEPQSSSKCEQNAAQVTANRLPLQYCY